MRFTLCAVRISHSGAWVVSTVYNNIRYAQQYIGYTKREALRAFKDYLKGL